MLERVLRQKGITKTKLCSVAMIAQKFIWRNRLKPKISLENNAKEPKFKPQNSAKKRSSKEIGLRKRRKSQNKRFVPVQRPWKLSAKAKLISRALKAKQRLFFVFLPRCELKETESSFFV